MPVLYPSLVCNIGLRFDEAFNINEDDSPDAQTTQSRATGQSAVFGPPTVRPLVLSGGHDQLSKIGGRQPRSATIELNGFRQAHTFELKFAFRDFPIDPRVIRDGWVDIFLGLVTPEAYARGVTAPSQDGSRSSVVDTEQASSRLVRRLMVGFFDEQDVEFSEGGNTVTIRGRDIRGVLMDAKADPRTFTTLDLSRPIDDVVRQIITGLALGAGVNVAIQEADWPDGVPSPASADGVTTGRRRPGCSIS